MSENNNIPENYRYTKEHEWIKRDENNDHIAIIGITDFAQEALGDVVHVEMPAIGDQVETDD